MKKLIVIVFAILITATSIIAQQKDFLRLSGPYLGHKQPDLIGETHMRAIYSNLVNHPADKGNLPVRFDWREKNIMTPVKHQMNLGSCGVFAAVAVFESLIKKETGKTVDLSEQQIINGSQDFVPSGISSVDAMKYIKQYGLVLEKRLPYRDKKTDEMPIGPPDYTLTDYHYVQTDKLELCDKIKTIKQALREYGPVATNMIFYQDLDRYKGNIYIYDGHSEEQGGHWVVIVGWQDDPDVKNGGYWICRNSWGEKWGENGYFNIAYGECGIDDFWFVYGIFTIASAPDLHSYSFRVFLAELSPALPIGHSSARTVLGPNSAGFPRRTEALVG